MEIKATSPMIFILTDLLIVFLITMFIMWSVKFEKIVKKKKSILVFKCRFVRPIVQSQKIFSSL